MTRWTAQDMPDQTGRTVVITGANSGLGYESTLAFARKNAHVVMACRNLKKAEPARDEILKAVPNAALNIMELDLSSLASVRAFADAYKKEYTQLDILMNNAGLMALSPRQETADAFEMQFGVNHLGHFALTALLLNTVLNTPHSRIVTLSSTAQYFGTIKFDDLQRTKKYAKWDAYGQSKLANILFGFELQRKLDAIQTDTISTIAQPGYSVTHLQNAVKSQTLAERISLWIADHTFGQAAAMGALPQLYAATAPDVKGGEFFGPHLLRVRGYPVREHGAKEAHNKEIAAKLWQVSEELTGLQYTFPA